MEILGHVDFTLPWAIGMGLLLVIQVSLHLSASARLKRRLASAVQLSEARVRRSAELDRSEFEARLRSVGEEQNERFEQFRANLIENELRRRMGIGSSRVTASSRLDRRYQVQALAQMGFENDEISKQLRLSRWETELLLRFGDEFSEAGKHHG